MTKKIKVLEVKKEGHSIIIPDGMSLKAAIDSLVRRMNYEEEETLIKEPIEGFVWDGALAFMKAMQRTFGWATPEPTPGFFGPTPPQMISVQTSLAETAFVQWGTFSLPGISGRLETGITEIKGNPCLQILARVKRKSEPEVRALAKLTREILQAESIYQGKAFKLRFHGPDGQRDTMPMPSFLDLGRVKPEELVFSSSVQAAIETSIFTPIRNVEECRRFRVPLKRGVLLYGPYGTGKSLTSAVTAKVCTESGWTFLYCERADELADMVKLAHHFQPAVIFCEDIDRVVAGERSSDMDDILNIIDGIESKSTEIMVVLTTNHAETINRALLRPGRLDAVIHVKAPDAEAVEKLLRLYGRKLIPDNADLSEVSQMLDGKIPAVIRECVERAKLSAIKLGILGAEGQLMISPDALSESVQTMQDQLALMAEPQTVKNTDRLGGVLQEIVETAARTVYDENN